MCEGAAQVLGRPDILHCVLRHLSGEDVSINHLCHLRQVCSSLRNAFDELHFSAQHMLPMRRNIQGSRMLREAQRLCACLTRLLPRGLGLGLGLCCMGPAGRGVNTPDLLATLRLNCNLLEAASALGLAHLDLRVPDVLVAALGRAAPLPPSLTHLALELVPWPEAEQEKEEALEACSQGRTAVGLCKDWARCADKSLAQLVAPLVTLQSFSLAWVAQPSPPRHANFSLATLAPSLPPCITALSVRLGRHIASDGSALHRLGHLSRLQQLTLERALCPAERQNAPPSLSSLTALHLASHRRSQPPLAGLGDSLAGLTSLRSLAITGGMLAAWPQHLPHSITWLELECRTGPPAGHSWSQLPHLHHLGLCSFLLRQNPLEGMLDEALHTRQELDLAALPASLRSLGCTEVRLSSSAAADGGSSPLGTLTAITALSLSGCHLDLDLAGQAPQQQVLPSLAALSQLRDLRLAGYTQASLRGVVESVGRLHALTRLDVIATSSHWPGLGHPPADWAPSTLYLASLPRSLRHLSAAYLRVAHAASEAPPATTPALVHLTALHLSCCVLQPSAAGPLLSAVPALRHLCLPWCGLQRPPWGLGALTHLTHLDLSHNHRLHYGQTLDLRPLAQLRVAFVGEGASAQRPGMRRRPLARPGLTLGGDSHLFQEDRFPDDDWEDAAAEEMQQYLAWRSDWMYDNDEKPELELESENAYWASGRYRVGCSSTAWPWAYT